LNIILILLSILGITYSIKEASLFDRPRVWIISKHPFFAKLFGCPFCVGFYSGLITYSLEFGTFNIRQLVLFGFVGAIISLFFYMIIDKFFSVQRDFN
jgi:hypothetical protein